MKYYPDGVAEGTPEEIAAFKHIDAALASRGKRAQLAIEGPKRPAKKAAPKAAPKKAPRKPAKRGELTDKIVELALAQDGVTAHDVAQHFEMDTKRAYNRLYALNQRGTLRRAGDGTFKVGLAAVPHAKGAHGQAGARQALPGERGE